MTFADALIAAGEIIENMFANGVDKERFLVCEENRDLICELQSACALNPHLLDWHVIGSTNGPTAYFVIRTKAPVAPFEKEGDVIHVDFKAKKRITEAA